MNALYHNVMAVSDYSEPRDIESERKKGCGLSIPGKRPHFEAAVCHSLNKGKL
jgi:hypothetical protein